MSGKQLLFLLVLLLLSACRKEEDLNFHGMWQSLNDRGLVVEIDTNDYFRLYQSQRSMYDDLDGFGELKIGLEIMDDAWRRFTVRDEATGKKVRFRKDRGGEKGSDPDLFSQTP